MSSFQPSGFIFSQYYTKQAVAKIIYLWIMSLSLFLSFLPSKFSSRIIIFILMTPKRTISWGASSPKYVSKQIIGNAYVQKWNFHNLLQGWSSWIALSGVSCLTIHTVVQCHYVSWWTFPSPSPYIQGAIKCHWVKIFFPYILNVLPPFHLCCFDVCSHHSVFHSWTIFLNMTPCLVFIPPNLPHCSNTNTKGNSDHGTHRVERILGLSSPEKKKNL